jgi:glyoxylase-like metal-dependent hydrolase (beta-lactamase superfamily II)
VTGQVLKNDDLQISLIGEKTWVIETSDKTTMYLIEGTDKALLIDTGTKCEKLDEVVRQITAKPVTVVLTHAHYDHAGNIRFFKEIYMHAADTVLLDKSYKGTIHFVEDGNAFDLGGKTIEVKHMPAHTPGSIVLLDRQSGSCFSGDAFGSGQVWLQLRPNAPMITYVNSCSRMEKIMDEGVTKIYCGHYPYVKKAFAKQYITTMKLLAESLINGKAPQAKPYPVVVSFGCANPMIVTMDEASIVFDPELIEALRSKP